MPWQISIVLYLFLSSFRSIQNRRIGLYKKDVTLYALVASFVCVFSVGLIYAASSWQSVDHTAAWAAKWYLLFGGTLFASLNVMVLKLYRYVQASIAVFMSLLNTLSVILVAYLFTDESLSSQQWVGAGLLFVAIIAISYLSGKKQNTKLQSNILVGIALAICTALLFGPAIVNEKYLIDRIGLETYVLYGWGMQAFSALAIAFVLKKQQKKVAKKKLPMMVHINVWVYGLFLGMAGVFFVLSLRNSESASITAVSSTARVALTMMMAYIVLKERNNLLVKAVGLILSGIGLYLVFI